MAFFKISDFFPNQPRFFSPRTFHKLISDFLPFNFFFKKSSVYWHNNIFIMILKRIFHTFKCLDWNPNSTCNDTFFHDFFLKCVVAIKSIQKSLQLTDIWFSSLIFSVVNTIVCPKTAVVHQRGTREWNLGIFCAYATFWSLGGPQKATVGETNH